MTPLALESACAAAHDIRMGETCPETGRPYECGHGALSREAQSANFIRERNRAADMPTRGERCPQTGREYECGSGAHTRTEQTGALCGRPPPRS